MPITKEIIKNISLKYPEIKTYIETGTGWGSSLGNAKEFFKDLHTIDIDNLEKIATSMSAKFYLGNSITELPKILDIVQNRCFIYLDAHICGNESKDLPLLKELEIIGTHKIKNHIITIDDIRILKHMHLTRETLETAIKNINPNYIISYLSDKYDKEDILVAEV